ncbi:ATP-binding cassette domain-containing protein [Noviherbaspirillum cavernae]|uniref:ATP-binding cassette domain-containing protein n=1 Tax=Noviherbaspirillum cavernae TaxID=2320862 RepID=A0A418X4R7_9BURK|nr:energy-coupling factor ABC transporter ATP-binding protein [Noviherbaspirillum cavernae]RJG07464.1 ATP-binding cassette domain-containing protein [Noviherbaspirillum cavernae]
MTTTTPLLTLRHLRKSYGERPLFDIEALTICAASAYVLTGLNGAGKSTLLRILAGLETAEVEAAHFLDQPVRLTPYPRAMREAVVYVHQHPIMFSTSVADNIAYGLSARGMTKAEIVRRTEGAMEWAGVTHLRDSRPLTLSGGEKQRVALARAKVLEPKLLLLDEPTSSLDGEAREQVIGLIPTLLESGSSIIMACHDRDLIALPGVQRLKLRDGRLQARQNRMRLA